MRDFTAARVELCFDGHLDLPEPYEFLMENSITKAKAALEQRPEYQYALGDDSGLFIEELDYMPGVHSRRWFGAENDDKGRNQHLLELLKDVDNRSAYLISRFALVDKNGVIAKTSVKNHFYIADEEKGKDGFGYDRLLIPDTSDSKESMWGNLFLNGRNELHLFGDNFDWLNTTVGEMTQEQKNAITYRGRIADYLVWKLEQ